LSRGFEESRGRPESDFDAADIPWTVSVSSEPPASLLS